MSPYLKHDAVDDVRILDGKVQRNGAGGRDAIAFEVVPAYAPYPAAVIGDQHGSQHCDACTGITAAILHEA